jgi:hypothetical protein
MEILSRLSGTLQNFFRIGTPGNGSRLKTIGTNLQIRDYDDTDFQGLTAESVTINNTKILANTGTPYNFYMPQNFNKGALWSDGGAVSSFVNMPYREIGKKDLSGLHTYDFIIPSSPSNFGAVTWVSFTLEIFARINKVGADGSVQVALGSGAIDTTATNYVRMSNGYEGTTPIAFYESPASSASVIIGGSAGSNAQTNRFTNISMRIQNAQNANKNVQFQISSWINGTSSYRSVVGGGHWLNTGNITRIRVYSGGGVSEPFATNSYANLIGWGY